MKFPPLLKSKDSVRIIAPSGIVKEKALVKALNTLESWGLDAQIGSHVFENSNIFSAKDEMRLKDFQEALNDNSIRMILCARGGYGLTRILDSLDLDSYIQSPKWVVGFSDITAFLQMSYRQGIAAIHGPMGTSFERNGAEESIHSLKTLLFNGSADIVSVNEQLRQGKATGQLIGGNLALVCDSIGTRSELNTENKILVLEDIGEYYYRIDRMLTQLKRSGKLSKLKALVLGSFNGMSNNGIDFGETVIDMARRLTLDYNYPIATHMPIGHEPANFPFVYGAEYQLEVKADSARLELLSKV